MERGARFMAHVGQKIRFCSVLNLGFLHAVDLPDAKCETIPSLLGDRHLAVILGPALIFFVDSTRDLLP